MTDMDEKIKKPRMQTFHAEEMILREGEESDSMYKILSGSAAVFNHYGEKDEHLIGIYSKGRCFGELNVFSDLPCIYTVVAYNDVLVMRVTTDSLEEFIAANPRNVIDIMRNMAHTIRMMQMNIEFLIDDFSNKEEENEKKREEVRKKIMRYTNPTNYPLASLVQKELRV